ncbi:hypothetical protein C7N43_36810 [Sphingobacteriales bacterium UPWRP_1]|nr:hypothetical protein B6N25_00530 [Sphingobacteriales bacterium TSM_CSS]PSJ71933.1 hypothetical protein C7N43_36810 [Sphingobacteriales bacterium UPWRP_1]
MKNNLLPQPAVSPALIFALFAAFTLLCIMAAAVKEAYFALALPFSVIFGLFMVKYFRQAFLLLWLLIPLSIEYEIGETLATDLPTEPYIILLMGVAVMYYFANPRQLTRPLLNHPITVLLCLHVLWIGITALYAQVALVSGKFFLAKLWYVSVFYFLSILFLREEKHFKALFWCIAIPLSAVIVQTTVRHALLNFEFSEVNKTMTPFFRNHVSYAVILAVFLPFALHARHWYKQGTIMRLVVKVIILLMLTGIVFAYTRAAYLSLLLIPVLRFVFAKQLTKWIAAVAFMGVLFMVVYYANDYRYLNLAPDYETTIYHANLEDHLTATFEGKDISSMERVYRWIAAFRMSLQHPLTGFGPGNFYNFYQYYTVDDFETYVSDNEERSGVHNYFLMTLVEQGFIGLLLFVGLCLAVLVTGENLYRRMPPDQKPFVMAVLVSYAIILFNLTMGDLIETDKIGSLFFMNMAILAAFAVFNPALHRKTIGKPAKQQG